MLARTSSTVSSSQIPKNWQAQVKPAKVPTLKMGTREALFVYLFVFFTSAYETLHPEQARIAENLALNALLGISLTEECIRGNFLSEQDVVSVH